MSVQVQSPYGRGPVLQKNFFLTLLICKRQVRTCLISGWYNRIS